MLVAALGATGWLLIGQAARAEPLADEAARQHKLDLQERCAQAAEKNFRSSGWKAENGSSYKSHYNQTLGVCLIEVYGHEATGSTNSSVSDAIEGRVYALYIWGPNGQFGGCLLIPTEKEKRNCTSEEEYQAFAATLMEQ
jgi:hypothetical protein